MYKWFFKVSHTSILLYQGFLEKYIIETSRQNIERKKYLETWQPDVIRLFNLTFLLLKCKINSVRLAFVSSILCPV